MLRSPIKPADLIPQFSQPQTTTDIKSFMDGFARKMASQPAT